MVCLGLEPGAVEWKAQMNPMNYDCNVSILNFSIMKMRRVHKMFALLGMNLVWGDFQSLGVS